MENKQSEKFHPSEIGITRNPDGTLIEKGPVARVEINRNTFSWQGIRRLGTAIGLGAAAGILSACSSEQVRLESVAIQDAINATPGLVEASGTPVAATAMRPEDAQATVRSGSQTAIARQAVGGVDAEGTPTSPVEASPTSYPEGKNNFGQYKEGLQTGDFEAVIGAEETATQVQSWLHGQGIEVGVSDMDLWGGTRNDGTHRWNVSYETVVNGIGTMFTPRLDAEQNVIGMDQISNSALERLGLDLSDIQFSPQALNGIADFRVLGANGQSAAIIGRQTEQGTTVLNFIPTNYTQDQVGVFPPELADRAGEIVMDTANGRIVRVTSYVPFNPDQEWTSGQWIAASAPLLDTPDIPMEVTVTPVPPTEVPPTKTSKPEPTATEETEIVLEEGEVKYEFSIAESSETIAVALPQEWVELIEKAESEPNQEHMDVPLAHARVEGEAGSRHLMVGNITVASEAENGWRKSETVYTIPDYLGFEGPTLAQDEFIGSVDPETSVPEQLLKRDELRTNADGIGFINITYLTNITPVEATRTHLVVLTNEGIAVESARMRLNFVYRTSEEATNSFSATMELSIGDDDDIVFLANWTPPLGVPQKNVGIIWASPGNLDTIESRESNLAESNYPFLMSGAAALEGGGNVSAMINGGEVSLPFGSIDNMEDDVKPVVQTEQ